MRLLILVVFVLLTSCTAPPPPQMAPIHVNPESFDSKFTGSSVMITNLAENSGGSGVVLQSSATASAVLTNSHVCEVAKRGGKVASATAKLTVSYYVQSKLHDLCLIIVSGNLGDFSPVADMPPKMFDKAFAVGHPRLLPTIVSPGHFSEKKLIEVLTGLKPCTDEEKVDPKYGLFCVFMGGIPQTKTFESIVLSSLIQPGSSGSPVFNSNGEVSALVFAGEGDIGYGFAVPHEYIVNFLNRELPNLNPSQPDLTSNPGDEEHTRQNLEEKIKYTCTKAKTKAQKELCAQFEAASKNKLL